MRYPIAAGSFYPSGRDELRDRIDDMIGNVSIPGFKGIRGVLVPHAGYIYSGKVAAHSFKAIQKDRRPDAYVIIGPDHRGIPFPSALCSESYLTPLGECHIHLPIAERLSDRIPDVSRAHMMEHSVEVEVPFIQCIDDSASIVPIVMSDQGPEYAEYLGEAIRDACRGYDVVVIASSDMSHYVPRAKAVTDDRKFLDYVCRADIDGMYRYVDATGISVCGYGPIAAMLHATGAAEGFLLDYDDSSSATGDSEAVVGYSSAVFV